MMQTISAICGLLALASLIAVIKPFGPYKKRWQAFLGFVMLVVIGTAASPALPPVEPTPQPAASSTPTPADTKYDLNARYPSTNSGSTPPPTPTSRWEYDEQRDEMRNASTKIACLASTNQLQFDFPYQGGSTARICFRESPQYGSDAYLTISRGQFTCLMDCRIRVKFDDGEVQSFGGGGASDGSSDVVFFTNRSRFLAGAKRASRIVIEADFYQVGAHQMVFENADGLEWPRP